ncbi:S24 family peptidase [Achromobacter marplatensis]|uniref:S24 family peptidase n=1 Tax=Achromobacter marplatensis TaxID=470868 RepID=UPI000277E43E|nr:S24 family peptidase [Achromobacter marplatensis]EJO29590.1 peptidase S24-like family protein [Achromobacter marplatensis]
MIQTYADRLLLAMRQRDVDVTTLAKALGMSYQGVKRVTEGKSKAFTAANNEEAAHFLRVSPRWLATGQGEMDAGSIRPADPWPLPFVNEAEVRALSADQLTALGVAVALAVAQLKLDVKVSAPPLDVKVSAPPAATKRMHFHADSSLVDMDSAEDAFPMRIKGQEAPPWDGGRTTTQADLDARPRISTQTGVVANVGPGDPQAANDKFEKVPEMADVRLAAGDGIENHTEEETGMVQFRRSFLRSVGADAGKARVVYAKGDSMEPVIKDGAALLVVPNENLTVRDLAAGGIYAINYDGKMIVKTVTTDRLTGRWVARSFNPAYNDIPLENGHPVRVLGQVVWAGSRLGDDEAGQWVRA